MENKKFEVMGMSYEEYRKMKYRMLEKAFMKANGWDEDEYEEK
jgi:hypothetical protein